MSAKRVLVTGSAGLIGSEVALSFHRSGWVVHGLDNNGRGRFFGPDGDVSWNLERLKKAAKSASHHVGDIRDPARCEDLVREIRPDLVVHCAAQPAHEYAAMNPMVDFQVNVAGTLNLLDACRRHCPDAVFVFCSSSKVYGRVNDIPFVELETRYDFAPGLLFTGVTEEGINEDFPVQGGEGRGVYGTNKAAADLLVQEYALTYGMRTVSLRGNCMTGGAHSSAELHGFLAYMARCVTEGRRYNIFGHKGKQVRDNIHSSDFASAILMLAERPPAAGSVYNLGGGRANSVSVLEAVELFQEASGKPLSTNYVQEARHGDHRVYITDRSRFRRDYPEWEPLMTLPRIADELLATHAAR